MCLVDRLAAAETLLIGAAAGRRGLGARTRPPSAAKSEMRKNEFMPPAPTERRKTRNRDLTCPNEIAELSVHYWLSRVRTSSAGGMGAITTCVRTSGANKERLLSRNPAQSSPRAIMHPFGGEHVSVEDGSTED